MLAHAYLPYEKSGRVPIPCPLGYGLARAVGVTTPYHVGPIVGLAPSLDCLDPHHHGAKYMGDHGRHASESGRLHCFNRLRNRSLSDRGHAYFVDPWTAEPRADSVAAFAPQHGATGFGCGVSPRRRTPRGTCHGHIGLWSRRQHRCRGIALYARLPELQLLSCSARQRIAVAGDPVYPAWASSHSAPQADRA